MLHSKSGCPEKKNMKTQQLPSDTLGIEEWTALLFLVSFIFMNVCVILFPSNWLFASFDRRYMAELVDKQMEETEDDPIMPDEVDPSEGSLQQNISISSLMLMDGGSAGSLEMVCSIELIIRYDVNVLMTIMWFGVFFFFLASVFLRKLTIRLLN